MYAEEFFHNSVFSDNASLNVLCEGKILTESMVLRLFLVILFTLSYTDTIIIAMYALSKR